MAPKHLTRELRKTFETLAEFANLGDSQSEWQQFREAHRGFFSPSQLAFEGFEDQLYHSATRWLASYWNNPSTWQGPPALLRYRNHLRAIWARTDTHGYNLATLLGFQEEAKETAKENPSQLMYDPRSWFQITGQLPSSPQQPIDTLPSGRPLINGVTGGLSWKFACAFQQTIYELMQERWRAKLCPKCGKHFIALKTGQKLCSDQCSDAVIRERALNYWHEIGSKRRMEAKAKPRKK